MADIDLPEELVEDNERHKVVTQYTPIGVVGAIVPWNFPLLLATGKISPALLTGNVIVVKPSFVSADSILVVATCANQYT